MEEDKISTEYKENVPLVANSRNENIRKYIKNGILVILAQILVSAYTLVSVLYVKNDNVDIIVIVFFRSLISSICTFLIALCFEGKPEPPEGPFYL